MPESIARVMVKHLPGKKDPKTAKQESGAFKSRAAAGKQERAV
jgi:hypothetical protein